ncbi:ABC transporter substrate-binding protein [Desulfotalea psychrophila]|uniref:Related to branched-chain amino acid ABC transporter, periplasmic substrate binding protein n=1 Tax=Desulfotalea psychrophila (strain LSv54 / DSM 12343) TaxID=177439 RepID=Q6AL52_DESPS|nr:ABC transporter substrate-binding protein [Desulfotalea psychrophila]CAG36923.1 related to branched-chain amino acid ABC transporter, periplasmic substrate binding protein [Desulfotalea psychrophila LSv54]
MKKEIIHLFAVAVLLLMSAGASWATENIKVGAILAVTGPASFLGGPELKSAKMLVQRINRAGGIQGKKIELIVRDSGGSSEKAISFARQLIEEKEVFAIIGPSTSGETLKIKKLCQRSKTLLLSCSSADRIVFPLASYVFKTAPSDGLAVEKIFIYMQKKGIKKIALLSGNTGFGKAGKRQILKRAKKYGIEVVSSEVYDKNATDLTAIVAKIKSQPGIEAVVNWSVVPAQSIVLKNIRQAGWDVPIFQSHGFANIKYVQAAGAAAEGVLFPASRLIIAKQLPAGVDKDFLLQFKNDYENSYGEEVSTFGGHSYDALLLLANAIKQVGLDREKVRGVLEATRGFMGTAGEFNFSAKDHSGLSIEAFTMLTVEDGKFVPYN